ncbi:hypothetical protein [Bradyrhizobium sp. SZCCHNR2032]|uniref:hypothetical protein n=1 Tax=Bradyrhizobium sp. SZCCHNR2032 TaxID=3057384 RepID=UPI002916B1F7|nr:hypothetical protein [Bradyrhizobium sp. SZCCHNR2032]
MADYAGAVAAIKSRLAAAWIDAAGQPLTLIVYANHRPEPPFPPIDPTTGNPAPVVVCEVTGTRSDVHTFGDAGNRFFQYDGLIILHVLVAINEGVSRAQALAVQAGEIFRAATFYQDPNGSYVRTVAPYPPDGGGAAELEGVDAGGTLYRVTVSIPFKYFHRA